MTEVRAAMELPPGLHRIQAPLGDRFVALYLLTGPEGGLLFDTGIADSIEHTLVPYLAEIGYDLSRLRWAINSHCDFDHTGGNGALLAHAPHVELMAGAQDVPMTEDVELLITERYGEFREADGFDDPPETTANIRESARLVPVARALDGGEEFDLGDRIIRVLHTPGHSDGHLALWDERNSALLIGDATLGDTVLTASGLAAFPPTYRDTDPYLASIATFRELDPALLLTAHYPVYEGPAVAEFLDLSEHYVARLDAAIEAALRTAGAPLTSLELISRIAGEVGDWSPSAAEYLIFPVTGNLERMHERGLLAVIESTGTHRTWEWIAA
jgi:glyoxylase-like metal-dependent hydrolase (beta-lactamase superfamily II)